MAHDDQELTQLVLDTLEGKTWAAGIARVGESMWWHVKLGSIKKQDGDPHGLYCRIEDGHRVSMHVMALPEGVWVEQTKDRHTGLVIGHASWWQLSPCGIDFVAEAILGVSGWARSGHVSSWADADS